MPQIKATRFVDVSCSGAETRHLLTPQPLGPSSSNAAQLDAVTAATKVVTVGIGGNDIGFADIVASCLSPSPTNRGCQPTYVHDGHDVLRERIDTVAPRIDLVLRAISQRAPRAKVFLVGYPTIVPVSGDGCFSVMPVVAADTVYLRGVAAHLNAMLAKRAAAAGATYVDTATSSIGHDYCSSLRWVEGLQPTSPAAPVHPNAAGMANTARRVAASINAVVPS